MGSEDRLIELLREMNRKLDRMEGSSFASYGGDSSFIRDGSSSRDPVDTVKRTALELEQFKETVKEAQGINKKVFKSMLDGLPIFGKYSKAIKESTKEVERQSRGQSEAFKRSASAMNEFAANVGVSSKSFEKVTSSMAKVQDSTKKLQELAKKREALESSINDSLATFKGTHDKLDEEYRNLPTILEEVNKKIRTTTSKTERERLQQTRANLEKLNEIPDAISKLKEVMNDSQLKKLSTKHPELKPLLDGLFKRLEGVLKRDESGATRSASTEETLSNIDELADSNDDLRGAFTVVGTVIRKFGRVFEDNARDLEKAMENLVKSIGAAVGEGISKEMSLVMARQRFTGNDDFVGYSARFSALPMGMSESDTLSALAENRNVLRRVAQDSGMAAGAGELLQTGGVRDLQQLSREMGLMGKEGLENIITVSDDIRVLGLRLNRANIADSVEFFRDTFKDLAMTQEQMRKFFADMSSEGMLRALSAGEDARLASIDSMQNEVEFRGKLARVLNQELEIQKKRVRELSGLAYGGPGEAIKRSVGVQILAEQAGMDASTVRLLGEQTRTGGVSLNEDERKLAATKYGQLTGDIGGMLHEAVRSDQTGMRALLTQMMGIAGLDGRDMVEAYIRRGGDIGDLNVEDITGSARAQTDRVASEVGRWGHATVTALEHMQGVLNSSIGKAAGAIITALGQYAMAGAAGAIGGRMAKKGFRPVARSIAGRTAGMGAGGLALGSGMMLASGAPRGSAMETTGNALSGVGGGAMAGSIFGHAGMAVGAVLGGLAGLGSSLIREDQRQETIDRAVAHQAMGSFGSENTSQINKKRSDLQKKMRAAFESGDKEEFLRLQREFEYGEEAAETRTLMQSMEMILNPPKKDRKVKLSSIFAGKGAGVRDINVPTSDKDAVKHDIDQFERHLNTFIESGEINKITTEKPLRDMIRVIKEEDVDVENEAELLKQLVERADLIASLTDEQKALLRDGNEQNRKMYEDMDANEIRQSIEASLTGQASAARNRIVGNANDFGERQ